MTTTDRATLAEEPAEPEYPDGYYLINDGRPYVASREGGRWMVRPGGPPYEADLDDHISAHVVGRIGDLIPLGGSDA